MPNVLDYGYVDLIETWGSDQAIIEAARMSTNKGFKGWPEDEKLLRYLWAHKHLTPFEMAGAIFELKAPICVFREWHRHRTQSYNELSARYTPLPDENYIPSIERLLQVNKQTNNKQATGQTQTRLSAENAQIWLDELQDLYNRAQVVYENGLNLGVAKELARLPVPVGRYSKMRASANLRNWLHFLDLRMTNQAMYEIRMYANAIFDTLNEIFPRTMVLFAETFQENNKT